MDFQEEVRAHRDLDNFLAQASIMLDERATTLDEVLRRMLARLLEEGRESCDPDEVMSSVFTDAGGKDFNGEQRARQAGFGHTLMWMHERFFSPNSSPASRNHSGCDVHFHWSSLPAVLALHSVSSSEIKVFLPFMLKKNNNNKYLPQ